MAGIQEVRLSWPCLPRSCYEQCTGHGPIHIQRLRHECLREASPLEEWSMILLCHRHSPATVKMLQ